MKFDVEIGLAYGGLAYGHWESKTFTVDISPEFFETEQMFKEELHKLTKNLCFEMYNRPAIAHTWIISYKECDWRSSWAKIGRKIRNV